MYNIVVVSSFDGTVKVAQSRLQELRKEARVGEPEPIPQEKLLWADISTLKTDMDCHKVCIRFASMPQVIRFIHEFTYQILEVTLAECLVWSHAPLAKVSNVSCCSSPAWAAGGFRPWMDVGATSRRDTWRSSALSLLANKDLSIQSR